MEPLILCPQCKANGTIATLNGPTCEHQEHIGNTWFPSAWEKMPLESRIAWLEKKNPPAR